MTKSRLERVCDVHILTLDDPGMWNATGNEPPAELVAQAKHLEHDPEARAPVVAGYAPASYAGADMPDVLGRDRARPGRRLQLPPRGRSGVRRALGLLLAGDVLDAGHSPAAQLEPWLARSVAH